MKHFFHSLLLAALLGATGTSYAQSAFPYECVTPRGGGDQAVPMGRQPNQTGMNKSQAVLPNPQPACAPPYHIKINVHYVLNADGTGNFNENDDAGSATAADWNIASQWMMPNGSAPAGQPLPYLPAKASDNGYAFAKAMVWAAIMQSQTNPPMQLPLGNTTPNPPKGIDYVLGGVYFHRNTDLAQYNPEDHYQYPDGVLSSAQFDQLGVNKDNEINVFLMGQVTKPSITPSFARWMYSSGGANDFGYTAGNNWIKLGNVWRIHLLNRVRNNGDDTGSSWGLGSVINHEIGHKLMLFHPFQVDNCADTPTNPASDMGNNLMDYGNQIALTPCQITNLQTELTMHYPASYYTCGGCLPPNAFFTLADCITINTSGDPQLVCSVMPDARGSFNETSYTYTVMEVDANNRRIGPNMTQSGTGEVGKQCLTMAFLPNTRYAIRLTVFNGCTNHSYTRYLSTACGGSSSRTAAVPLTVYPNPATPQGFTLRSATSPATLPTVRDSQGKAIAIEQVGQSRDEDGTWHTTYRLAKAFNRPGLYVVEATSAGQRSVQRLEIRTE